MRDHSYYVYITTNPDRKVLYTGMTNDITQRITEHYLNRGKLKTFAGRYYCYQLIYFEEFQWVQDAQAREKQIKGWTRKKKLDLIKQNNPNLNFLNSSIMDNWPPKDGSIREPID
ncbi:MAG: GIY-YIG nuclease family protein [Cyclobacteriaceae bacterium]|nr:GIY-YIG nuclease family protein [Cyclobacteriaceae bacterium]